MNTETLRETLHGVARTLYHEGGKCARTPTCIQRHANVPISNWDVADLCERCAVAWHALMAAMLIDSVIVTERFSDFVVKPVLVPPSDVLLANFAKIWDAAAEAAETLVAPSDATEDALIESFTMPVTVENGVKHRSNKAKMFKKAAAAAKEPKEPAAKKTAKKPPKQAAPANGVFTCKHCSRTFKQANWKTMHERFCEG